MYSPPWAEMDLVEVLELADAAAELPPTKAEDVCVVSVSLNLNATSSATKILKGRRLNYAYPVNTYTYYMLDVSSR
ncbi:MAG: hypothetical protein WCK65_15535, partial [Rhodospirillaceae bacterium]